MLPSAMWSLYEELSALNVSVQTDNYNFYSDANLPMVRQLISLVNKVELRFHELQQVDEIGFMQPLADVLTACETLLSLVHTEPLASILPKLEHLHMIVYEWQHGGYAPAIYGAPALYTALTDMIISWRREELKTWARLFDLEAQKCRDDANSWFFMAYQVVVAVPLTLADKADELQEYAVSLVKELGNYFSTSIVGQFSGRLALLRQMQKHLELLTLRLILNPSQSTKLSGSFRTGKRLNIKKIIPYIASSYKRDKIWMRRAVPTKRSYQILLCVDDSRSMGETAAGGLALESLVMVSRALTMLEVGQVGVLGFGADVVAAHALDEPFASHDAGARVLQRFAFDQDRTDVAMLVRRTIDRFRDARARNPARGAEDLWQLALVLSDGLTPSSAHDAIRRLLREAMEERIMIVFIVMDDTSHKDGDSVLDLKEAKFVKDEMGNSKVVIERYLDTFPFQYYLI
ncbi:hypothetical protein BN1708_017044, partial [Verticillium longisporum]